MTPRRIQETSGLRIWLLDGCICPARRRARKLPLDPTADVPATNHSSHPILRLLMLTTGILASLCPAIASAFEDDANLGARLQLPVESISSSFIEQIAADDLEEALAYSAGLISSSLPRTELDYRRLGISPDDGFSSRDFSPSNSGTAWGYLGRNRDNALAVRGFTNQTQQRLGFRVGTAFGDGRSIGQLVDTANVERLEVVRGPAGLFYGVNVLSGLVNVVPKAPLSRQAANLRLTYGTHNYARAVADVTGPIVENLNYRVIAVGQTEDDWTDYAGQERYYAALQLAYTPFERTRIFVEYQFADQDFSGIGPQFAFDFLGSRLGLNHRGEPLNWARDLYGADTRFRWSGPDTYFQRESQNILVTLDQELLENLTLRLGASWSRSQVDERNLDLQTYTASTMPAGLEALGTDLGDGLQRALIGAFYDNRLEVQTWQMRAELDYQITLGETAHSIVAGYSGIRDEALETGINPGLGNLAPLTWKRLDDLSPFRYEQSSVYRDASLNSRVGPGVIQNDDFWLDGVYLVYRGSFLEDRLQLFFGGRRDFFKARELRRENLDGEPGDILSITARQEFGPLRDAKGFRYEGETLQFTSINVGASYTFNEDFSVYLLRATGLNPNPGQIDGQGNLFDAETTTSYEAGFKFDLFDGRLYGTVSLYLIERENAVWSEWAIAPAPARWGTLPDPALYDGTIPLTFDPDRARSGSAPLSYGIHRDYFTAAQLATDERGNFLNPGILGASGQYIYVDYEQIGPSGLQNSVDTAFASDDPTAFSYQMVVVDDQYLGNNPDAFAGANVPFTEDATGIDLQLVYSPVPNWQIRLNYAFTEREVTAFTPSDYLEVGNGTDWGTEYNRILRTLGGETLGTNTRPSTITTGTIIGQDLGIGPRHEATLWTNYRFLSGPLAGLDAGLGLIYIGQRQASLLVGNEDLATNPAPRPETEDVFFANLSLGYKTSLWGQLWNFRLNVYNLFDTTHSTATTQTASGLRTTEEFHDPLSLRFSASISF